MDIFSFTAILFTHLFFKGNETKNSAVSLVLSEGENGNSFGDFLMYFVILGSSLIIMCAFNFSEQGKHIALKKLI